MEEEQELQNPFPSPPSHYTNFTTHNLYLLSLLKSRLDDTEETSATTEADIVQKQHELLANESDVPDWPLTQLEKPRVDWILEEGVYNAFGDAWFTNERIPTLSEMGGTQLYPEDPTVDRRPALQSVLRTLLHTYSSFLSSILVPPPSQASEVPPDWQRLVEWMRVMGQNIMGAANDLRPVQARGNLEAMMTRQLELRREETKAIHAKCDALETKLAELRRRAAEFGTTREKPLTQGSAADIMDVDTLFDETPESTQPLGSANNLENGLQSKLDDGHAVVLPQVSDEEALRWAEEVG